MRYRDLKKKRWFRIASNKYVLILTVFVIWMLFLDSNSWLVHRELDQKIDRLKSNNSFYKEQIDNDEKTIKQLNDSAGRERYAREKYYMKRDNEDVYVIENADSTNSN